MFALVEHQAICQIGREATLAPLLGAQSLTPVTQGTGCLQVTLVEHVCLVAAGQEIIQHVPVSSRIVAYILIILTGNAEKTKTRVIEQKHSSHFIEG